jgi:hypothetical protein
MTIDTKYNHLRSSDSLYGGATIGWTIQEEDDSLITAIAVCSEKDRFCKAEGRKIVDTRIKNIILSPEDKSKFVAIVTLDEVRAFLYENSSNAFPVLNHDAALQAIELLTLNDLNYNTLEFITLGVFEEIL